MATDIGTLVRQVEGLAALNPDARAIIIQADWDAATGDAVRDALGALARQNKIPWCLIVPGEVAIADAKLPGPNVGVFLGLNELAELLEMTEDEIQEWAARLLDES